jgi:hypothetical protein
MGTLGGPGGVGAGAVGPDVTISRSTFYSKARRDMGAWLIVVGILDRKSVV